MKYWRGYVTAAIFAFFSWALLEFAKANSALIDMVYPYVTRTLQGFLSQWSGGVDVCLWQILLAIGVAVVLVSALLMILLRWNPVQWVGWVLASVSIVFFLNTCVYGMNASAGSIATDVRMEVTEYTLRELEQAAEYYRDQAQAVADKGGDTDFDTLAQTAASGFEALVFNDSYSIFAGPVEPVKKLNFPGIYTGQGKTGMVCALTGEACVNPETPAVMLPAAICKEMAKRMCIASESDALFASYLACRANDSPQFQYAGYVLAYRYCYNTLLRIGSAEANAVAKKVHGDAGKQLVQDLETWDQFIGEEDPSETGRLLVSWHIQHIVLPTQAEEDAVFDPYDENQVDLSGIVNARKNG